MMNKIIVTGTLALLFLTGCAENKNTHLIKAENGSSLTVNTIFAPTDMNNNTYADVKLRQVTPARAGTGMGIAVLSAVLGAASARVHLIRITTRAVILTACRNPPPRISRPKPTSKSSNG